LFAIGADEVHDRAADEAAQDNRDNEGRNGAAGTAGHTAVDNEAGGGRDRHRGQRPFSDIFRNFGQFWNTEVFAVRGGTVPRNYYLGDAH